MCGREDQLVSALVEEVELKVCHNCAKYGQVKPRNAPNRLVSRYHAPKKEGPQLKVVEDYASLIRTAREKRLMTQEDFAKFLNEKEGTVIKWEQGSLKPDVDSAYKIGRLLHVNLILKEEEAEEQEEIKPKRKNDEFTLGDFIKKR